MTWSKAYIVSLARMISLAHMISTVFRCGDHARSTERGWVTPFQGGTFGELTRTRLPSPASASTERISE
jgi:hypothetical protein